MVGLGAAPGAVRAHARAVAHCGVQQRCVRLRVESRKKREVTPSDGKLRGPTASITAPLPG